MLYFKQCKRIVYTIPLLISIVSTFCPSTTFSPLHMIHFKFDSSTSPVPLQNAQADKWRFSSQSGCACKHTLPKKILVIVPTLYTSSIRRVITVKVLGIGANRSQQTLQTAMGKRCSTLNVFTFKTLYIFYRTWIKIHDLSLLVRRFFIFSDSYTWCCGNMVSVPEHCPFKLSLHVTKQ